ncbi:MAG: FAD-dependent oxidoreductase, partial [Candidatus Hodarchaeota archaeon]
MSNYYKIFIISYIYFTYQTKNIINEGIKTKILNNAIIKDKYDVIIIGAGIGGLTAASLLAKKGLDILLCEHHFMPGGCCSSVRRGGVTSDVGASLLFGFSEKGLTQHRFVHNCLEEPIDVIRDDSIFRLHWKGKDGKSKEVTVWRDFERYFKELCEAFPGKEAHLKAFYEYLGKLYDTLTSVEMPMAFTELPPSMAGDFFSQSDSLLKVLNMTGKELMEEFFTDPELIAFFDMIIMTMNTVKSDVNPAILSAMVFADCNRGGAFYPVGSPQMIPNKMERAFERFGGTILYRHKVVEILFDTKKRRPRACGVRLDNGMEIYANNIVSNTNIYNFYGGLIKPELCKPGIIEKTMDLQATGSVLLTYLSVNAEVIPEDARPVEVYISEITDLENMKVRFVFTPSLEDPTLAPEGIHSLTIAQQADPEMWPRPDDPFYQTDDYNGLKEQVADKMLSDLEEFYPGLRKHIRTMEIATPTTLERFTLKYKGNIGGPAQKMGQALFDREHARTKGYKNLYMCGDSTTMGTGVVAACASGVSVANSIIEDQKIGEIYLPKKFEKQYINYVGPDLKPLIPLLDPEHSIEMDKDAMRCARECNWCDSDNCREKCPSNIDVNNFIRRIEVGNFKGAAQILREMNPLAEICGYICPAEKLCESECYRLEYKETPVRIKDLQKWVCEKTDPEGW